MSDTLTFSLSSLCGCPSPCASCCGHDCGACTGVPDTVYATVTSSSAACACAVGNSTALLWNGSSEWVARVNFDGATCSGGTPGGFLLHLRCNAGVYEYSADNGTSGCINFGSIGWTPVSTTVCSPWTLTVNILSIKDCCNGSALANTVTFTFTT